MLPTLIRKIITFFLTNDTIFFPSSLFTLVQEVAYEIQKRAYWMMINSRKFRTLFFLPFSELRGRHFQGVEEKVRDTEKRCALHLWVEGDGRKNPYRRHHVINDIWKKLNNSERVLAQPVVSCSGWRLVSNGGGSQQSVAIKGPPWQEVSSTHRKWTI